MVRSLWSLKTVYTFMGICLLVASLSTSTAQVYAPIKSQANTQTLVAANTTLNTTANANIAGTTAAYGQTNALELAQQKVQQARQAYGAVKASVDQPLWKDALGYIDRVYRTNPTDLDVLYFATVIYNEVAWDYQVWEYGRAYLEAGGVFDDLLIQILTEVGNDLGYSYYKSGNTEFAIAYFEAVSQINPLDYASLQEIGTIYSEAGFPEDAAAYWQAATMRGSSEASYLLERTQLELYIGPEATDAFYHGIEHYEEGSLEEAKDAFSIAVELNPSFTESWRWLARTLMESCISQDALWAWQNYVELVPNDETANHFIAVVNEQLDWGCEAGTAYMEGLSLYETAQLVEANQYFAYAASLDTSYLEANRWAARTYQELGDAESALYYWHVAQALAPQDDSITYFIELLESNSVSNQLTSNQLTSN